MAIITGWKGIAMELEVTTRTLKKWKREAWYQKDPIPVSQMMKSGMVRILEDDLFDWLSRRRKQQCVD